MNKSIYFVAPGIAELQDREIPEIAPDEVLVKINRTTISAGTERANLVGDPNVSPARIKKEIPFPRRSGYSAAGTVVAVGTNVTSHKVGDRVACSWTKHAEYFAVKERCAYRLPDSVSDAEGSLVHIATFPLAAIRKCDLELGESAIIMGLGVLGLVSIGLLRAAGAAPIIAVDPVPEKRELALSLGADFALDPFASDFVDRVMEITDGGVKVALEITGKGQGLDMVLDCMAKFGRVALLGCTRNSDFSIDYYRKVHAPGITLVGAHTIARPKLESHEGWWTEKDDAEAIIKLVELGRLNLSVLVEDVISPLDAPEIYDKLAKNPAFPIVQFDWTQIEEK